KTAIVIWRSLCLCKYGRVSREWKASVAVKGEAAHLSAIKLLSDFFTPPCGARNLWDLVLIVRDDDDSLLPVSYSKGIIHNKTSCPVQSIRSTRIRNSASFIRQKRRFDVQERG
ncbi:WD repeat-containing protein 17, partial [Desmophyllum pertusum]